MSKIYSIDVRIYGTAYIRAESPEAALVKAKELADTGIGLEGDEVADCMLDDPEMPEVSLSPAATIKGPDEGDHCTEV